MQESSPYASDTSVHSDPGADRGVLAMLDIGFKRFFTLSVIKVLYVLGLALIVLSWVVLVIGAFLSGGFLAGIGVMIGGTLAAVLYMIFFRVWLELIVVIFRIGENTTKLVEMKGGH